VDDEVRYGVLSIEYGGVYRYTCNTSKPLVSYRHSTLQYVPEPKSKDKGQSAVVVYAGSTVVVCLCPIDMLLQQAMLILSVLYLLLAFLIRRERRRDVVLSASSLLAIQQSRDITSFSRSVESFTTDTVRGSFTRVSHELVECRVSRNATLTFTCASRAHPSNLKPRVRSLLGEFD
jgi:hypothetical protein